MALAAKVPGQQAAATAPSAGASLASSGAMTAGSAASSSSIPEKASLPGVTARAVSPDPSDTTGKRALKRRWTLIHGQPASQEPREWRKTLTEVRTVSTAEDLILALAAMETPSSLVGRLDGHQLFMFQEGAKPDWKDPLVKSKGGRWDLPLRYTTTPQEVLVGAEEESRKTMSTDEVWTRVLLQVAGEGLPHCDDIVGVAIERKADRGADLRAGDAWMLRLSLWVQTGADLEKQVAIGCALRDSLRLPEESIAFCSFRREDRDSNPRITI